MGALAKWGTKVVVLVNTIFGVFGFVLLIVGVCMRFKPDMLDKLSAAAMYKISEEIPEDAGIDLKDLKLSDMVGDAATPMIALGVALLAVVAWAYCGTCLQSRWMLVVYACILAAVIIGEVVLAIMITKQRDKLDDSFKKPLKESLTKYYMGEKGKDIISMGWNALMGLLHCCGVDGMGDFAQCQAWNQTYVYTDEGTSQKTIVQVEAPLLCCENKTKTCSQKPAAGSATVTDNSYNKGCYEAIWDVIDKETSVAAGIASAILVIEVVLFIFVVAIIRDLGKKNKVGPED